MKPKKELVHDLNDLLERNYDAIQGYKDAARNVTNEELKRFFINQAKERLKLSEEVKVEIRLLGGNPVKEGSLLGIFHRSWMNFKTSLNHDNEKEVCQACITGEEKAVREYDQLLDQKGAWSDRLKLELQGHRSTTLQAIRDLESLKEKF
ncbi:ferritin-like domain-containing protein [Lunatimonas salinarum]|uniref:ferritin-like domain-containing protein n=1 Tax=Lunatimonas salinarum TaxID=1774590 RepID=UPI001ADF3CE0|nr:PA2169 family four-helix-bundle protein [Lunatimonas salinarum]